MLNIEELKTLQAELQTLNLRVLNERLSDSEREAARKKTVELANKIASVAEKGDAPVFLINLNKRRFLCYRSWGSYWIPGCGKQQFSSTVIAPMIISKQGGPGWNKKTETVYCRARQIADDLCKQINGDLLDLGVSSTFSMANQEEGPKLRKTLGVFVSDSSIPTKELLKQEELDLGAYYSALVDEGDAIYAKNRDRKFISNLHFEAAAYLGMNVSAYLRMVALERSVEVLKSNKTLLLSDVDRDLFFKALENPPKSNKNLKKAFSHYRRLRKNKC